MDAAAVHPQPGRRPEPLQMLQCDLHRLIVHLEDTGVAGEGPQDADGFNGAENVASNPATARITRPSVSVRSTSGEPSGVPDRGSRPSNTTSNASVDTTP